MAVARSPRQGAYSSWLSELKAASQQCQRVNTPGPEMGDLFLLTVLSSGGGGPGIVACGWECSNPCLLPAPATVGCEPSPGREMTQSSHSRQRGEGKENHPLIRATLFLIIHSGTYLVLGTVLSALYVVPHLTLKTVTVPFYKCARLPRELSGKEYACNAGDRRDLGSILGWGRSSGGGNSNPLQYSCLENSMDGGVWWTTVHGAAKSWTGLSH